MKMLGKLSEKLVAQYQRWLFEQRKQESVLALLEWATQEAEPRYGNRDSTRDDTVP